MNIQFNCEWVVRNEKKTYFKLNGSSKPNRKSEINNRKKTATNWNSRWSEQRPSLNQNIYILHAAFESNSDCLIFLLLNVRALSSPSYQVTDQHHMPLCQYCRRSRGYIEIRIWNWLRWNLNSVRPDRFDIIVVDWRICGGWWLLGLSTLGGMCLRQQKVTNFRLLFADQKFDCRFVADSKPTATP